MNLKDFISVVSPADLCLPILSSVGLLKGGKEYLVYGLTKIGAFVLQIIKRESKGKNKISLVRKLSQLTIRTSGDNMKICPKVSLANYVAFRLILCGSCSFYDKIVG